MQYSKAHTFFIKLLRQNLPPTLYYHDVNHTLDVIESAQRIAETEKLGRTELILLKTAALCHDTGFVNVYAEHEAEGCRIARAYLPQFNYSPEQIRSICAMIMATKMPQQPHNLLEKMLCDADLDYLGRDDYFTISQKLYDEWLAHGIIERDVNWGALQIRFLSNHQYLTVFGQSNREPIKQQNIELLKEKRV
jgi:uncharacterized protein